MALSFLEPITAPIPVLPAAFSSEAMIAYFTNFSPAGPIQATLVKFPSLSFKISVVSKIFLPHKSEASLISIPFSVISM